MPVPQRAPAQIGKPDDDGASRYPLLQRPLRLGTLTLPHRILMGSMHLNHETGDPAALAAFYLARVRGGAGLIITGGAAVSRVGAGGRQYALINEPGHWPRWQHVVDAVHSAGGLIGLQLFHAGRYAFFSSFGLQPVAPSAVYSRFSGAEPLPLDEAGIAATLADFASAATAAAGLGFDAVEIMASEGYLLNQFASPLTNLRQDAWGGDAVRRRAFPTAVTTAVRQAVLEMPLLVRLCGDDLMPGSSTPEEVDALAIDLVRAGADAVDVGIGWHESRIPTVQSLVPHGAWVDVAGRIKSALLAAGVDVPVIAANRINSMEQAEEVLRRSPVDLVSMARPFLADPALLAKSFAGRPLLVNTCIGCNEACIDRSLGEEQVSCLVNPRAGRELEFPDEGHDGVRHEPRDGVSDAGIAGSTADGAAGAPFDGEAAEAPFDGDAAGAPFDGDAANGFDGVAGDGRHVEGSRRNVAVLRRIGVIGAGPAGMEAARALAANGAHVTLWETGPRIGGQFLLAGQVPGKADFLQTVRYFEAELARLDVRLELNTTINAPEELAGYDHVIVAAGVRPRLVELPGLPGPPGSGPQILDYAQAFARLDTVGARVAIIGAGGIAVDLAHLLATGPTQHPSVITDSRERHRFLIEHALRPGALPPPLRQVTIMRRAGSIGAGKRVTTLFAPAMFIGTAGVRTLTNVAYKQVTSQGLVIQTDGGSELIAADTVIIAAGQEPATSVARMLADAEIPHTVIGGAQHTFGMNAVAAFEQGLREGTRIARQSVARRTDGNQATDLMQS